MCLSCSLKNKCLVRWAAWTHWSTTFRAHLTSCHQQLHTSSGPCIVIVTIHSHCHNITSFIIIFYHITFIMIFLNLLPWKERVLPDPDAWPGRPRNTE